MNFFKNEQKYIKIMSKRAKGIVDQFDEFIAPGESYLLVGDGDGFVTAEAKHRCGLEARGLDLKIQVPLSRKRNSAGLL